MAKLQIFTVLSSILLFVQLTNINAQDPELNGRLLTPEQGCGISKVVNPKIVGGTEAKPGAFPWMILTGKTKGEEGAIAKALSCGGTLITSRHILTAARCVHPHLSYVKLGEHNLNETSGEEQEVQVIKAVTHPDYNEIDRTNDIAVLTLKRDVEFNDYIRPICLPLTDELTSKSFIGTNPFVAGWGLLKEDGPRSSVLMQVQLPVIGNEVCKEQYKQLNGVFSNQQFSDIVMCAGYLEGGKDSCLGDSGGPLMLPISEGDQFPMYQIGVVSYRIGCGRPNMSGTYTRVSKFIDWIKTQLE